MSSRFISAGSAGETNESTETDEAWTKAQEQIEATRSKKAEVPKNEGSLYETLQANKARLSNQFRSLDEDEVDFLDSVLESTRAKEAEVKKETSQQLDIFRKQQEEAEKEATTQQDSIELPESESWRTAPRKRKKRRESGVGGLKLRKMSTAEDKADATGPESSRLLELAKTDERPIQDETPASPSGELKQSDVQSRATPATGSQSATGATGLGLAAYSSDEED